VAASAMEITIDPKGLEDLQAVLADFMAAVDRIERAVAALNDSDECRCQEAIGRC